MFANQGHRAMVKMQKSSYKHK